MYDAHLASPRPPVSPPATTTPGPVTTPATTPAKSPAPSPGTSLPYGVDASHSRRRSQRTWKSGLKRAGIEVERKRMMHALRHTAVLVWLSRGISTKAVAEFIGDTKHTVISTYSHLMPDDRDKARRAMEDFMNGPAQGPSRTVPEGSELKIVP